MHMLPTFLKTEFDSIKLTDSDLSRFYKSISFTMTLVKYITAIMAADALSSDLKNKELDTFIVNNFAKPSEGSWLSLMQKILRTNDIKTSSFGLLQRKINHSLFTDLDSHISYLLNNSKGNKGHDPLSFFQRTITIKNRFISHGTINEGDARHLYKYLIVLIKETISFLNPILSTPLCIIENTAYSQTPEIHILYPPEKLIFNDAVSYLSNDGLYFYINERFVDAWPFLATKDGKLLLYNRFDDATRKVFFSSDREIFIHTDADELYGLFGIDQELIHSKTYTTNVRVEKSGISHNLPIKDYDKFLGRITELKELQEMMHHQRHYIFALDGIGGVGKSALALEFCYQIATKQIGSLNFEYVVWLSAKNTIFINNKIVQLEQSLEHLDQVLDAMLIVLGFPEICIYQPDAKKHILSDLLPNTNMLIVLDNLETIKSENLLEIWSFFDELPPPSKVLLTSREIHHNIHKSLRIESLNQNDSEEFISIQGKELGIPDSTIDSMKSEVANLSSGLPVVIKSILSQISMGKNLGAISRHLGNAGDDLVKFCFEDQIKLLDDDQKLIILVLSLIEENLDDDKLTFLVSDLLSSDLYETTSALIKLSLIKIEYKIEANYYNVLDIIKRYVISSFQDSSLAMEIKRRIKEYYELRDIDNYDLFPVEARTFDRVSLLPRKLVDKAMMHANHDEFEQAENEFQKAIKAYPNESYIYFMHGLFIAQQKGDYQEAISALKKAHELSPSYIHLKKIGDLQLKLKNFQTAINYYKRAALESEAERDKVEMLYSIANAQYIRVKKLRRELHSKKDEKKFLERNECYADIISSLGEYIAKQPSIHEGKLIKIHRLLAESYFGLRDQENALKNIDIAIDLSQQDQFQIGFKNIIIGDRK